MNAHQTPPDAARSNALEALLNLLIAGLDQVDPMLSIEDACAAISCGPIKLRSMLAAGELPGLKIGKEWVIPRRAFFQALNERALSEMLDRSTHEEARTIKVGTERPAPAFDFGVGVPVGMHPGNRGRPRKRPNEERGRT